MASHVEMDNPHADVDGATIGNIRLELGDVTRASLKLARLQSRLLVEDWREVVHNARRSTVILVVVCLIMLSALPVAVLGLGFLVAWTGLDEGLSLLLVAVVMLASSGGVAWLSLKRLKTALEPLERSRQEMVKNVNLVKGALRHREQAG